MLSIIPRRDSAQAPVHVALLVPLSLPNHASVRLHEGQYRDGISQLWNMSLNCLDRFISYYAVI